MDKTSILIADDEPAFRSGLRALLKSADELALVGDAATGSEAIRLAADLQPDIILMDINMPGVNGIEATRRILNTSPHIGILILTMFEDDDSVFAAMRAGICSKGRSKPKSCEPFKPWEEAGSSSARRLPNV